MIPEIWIISFDLGQKKSFKSLSYDICIKTFEYYVFQ